MTSCLSIQNGYKIPNIVHQTFISSVLPLEIIKIINHNKKLCSNCEFKFYDDADCDNFIKKNFDSKVYNAFKSINPVYGAMKADFFRYCVLYKIGGIYLDIKSVIKVPIFKIIKKDDICILDLPRNNAEPWRRYSPTYEQWLLMFAPNHPYLLEMINTMVQNILIKYVPKMPNFVLSTKQKILNVTGPDAFTKVVNTIINKNNNNNNNNKKGGLHRSINYDLFSCINILGHNYKQIYRLHGKKHYSEYKEPLYK